MEKLFEYQKEYYTCIEFQNYCEWLPKSVETNLDPFDEFTLKPESFYYDEWKAIKTTNTKESFEENFLNQICNVSMIRHTLLIEKDHEKVRIKFYFYNKVRGAGKKYYKLSTNVRFYTYNYVRNAFYEGMVDNFHKKRKFTKKIRRIGPSLNPLSAIRSNIYGVLQRENYTTINAISTEEKTNKVYQIFLDSIPEIKKYNHIQNSDHRFYKLYYDKQGVKLPDNWDKFIFSFPQPKLRLIRKNKLKYIDALMSINKFKGDKMRRVLHRVNNFNPENYRNAVRMFGEDFILQQSDDFLKKLIESNIYLSNIFLNLPPKEKKNAFEIFKLVVDEQLNSNTFSDHYNFHNTVNRFEQVKWKSTDLESFRNEHLDWSERVDFYTRGDYKRIYDDRFVSFAQESIFDSENKVYHPVLLKSSKEYNEESFIQSNCVKTYIQKPSSLIISLRKGSPNSNERATIEYRILMINEKIYLNRVQTLGRFNQALSQEWAAPLALLDSRIRNSMKEFEYDLPMIEAKFGHKSVVAKGVFKKHNSLVRIMDGLKNDKDDTLYLLWDRNISINNYETTPIFNLQELDIY